MADFVTKFHNLEGDLLGERKKSFFKLLTYTSANSNQSDIDNAIKNLKPKTYLEKLFWVETLIYFKKIEILKDILKQGNREYVKIIVRQKWFIEGAFKDMSAVELVNEFFPCVSYSTRLKLLRRISNCWSEEKVDALFDAVEKRYGPFIAKIISHACSTPKLTNILTQNEIIFNTYQSTSILIKSEQKFEIYVNYITNLLKKSYTDENTLNILAMNHPALFLKLETSNKINPIKLTKAASLKIIKMAKEHILNNPQRFLKFLNQRALVREIKSDFVVFYKTIFSQNTQYLQMLKYYPKKRRWNLYYEVCKNLEGVDRSSILLLNPSKATIYKWAEVNYKLTNDEQYLVYFPTAKSVPMIKEKINVTSEKSHRISLLKLLISTCSINQDKESLDKVLEYIELRRHKKEVTDYIKIVNHINAVLKNEKPESTYCNFLYKQILLLTTKEERYYYEYRPILDDLLEYSFKTNRILFRNILIYFIKQANSVWYRFRIDTKDIEIEKEVFIETCKLFYELIPTEHQYFHCLQLCIITEFVDFCVFHPERCINMQDFPDFVSAIRTACNKTDDLNSHDENLIENGILYNINVPQYKLPFLNRSKIEELLGLLDKRKAPMAIKNIISLTLCKTNWSKGDLFIINYYLERLNKDNFKAWFLVDIIEYHPKLLLKSFGRLWEKIAQTRANRKIKHYSHLGYDKQLCEYLLVNWNKSDLEQQKNTVEILLDLLPEDDFYKFVDDKLNPENNPVDLNEAGGAQLFAVQCHTAGILKRVSEPIICLSLVLKVCKGDYLPWALTSLYSLFYRLPENKIRPYLEILSKGYISARKHAVFLSCELLDSISILNLLKTADSSTKHLCLATLKYYIKNSSEELFILSKKYLELVNKSHKEIFSTLVKVKVPVKYRARYAEICWKIFENIDDEKIKVNKYFDKLLEQLLEEEVLKSLSSSFVKNTINRYLPIQGKNRLANIDQFALLCLEYRSTERPNNFTAIFHTLSNLNKLTVRGFCTIFTNYVQTKKPDTQFMNSFVANWNKYFSITDSLDEHIVFNLLLKYSNNSFENYSKSVVEYLEQLIYELGPQVFDIFKTNFEKIINKFKKLDEYNLLYYMLNHKPSAATCVLVIQLLTPVINEESEELQNVYIKITQILGTSNEDIVKSYYESYLRKIET